MSEHEECEHSNGKMMDQRREVHLDYQAVDSASGMVISSFTVHLVSPSDSLDEMIVKAKEIITQQQASLPRGRK